MSKTLVILHAESGCDYSINCGTKLIAVPPNLTGLEAVKWIEAEIRENYSGERSLTSAVVIEVANERAINLPLLYAGAEREKAEAALKATVAWEKSEYERLQKKFGGKS